MGGYRLGVMLMIAATVVLDGLDNRMLGLAAPALIREWGLGRGALGAIFALVFVGMMLGTLAAGQIGDRLGRRRALLLGVAVFLWRAGRADDRQHEWFSGRARTYSASEGS